MNAFILIWNFKSEIWFYDPPFRGGAQILSVKLCVCVFISTENVAKRKVNILASVINSIWFLCSVPVFWKGLKEGVMRMQIGMEKIQQSL